MKTRSPVEYLAAAIALSGVAGIWATIGSSSGQDATNRAVGIAAVAAFTFAAIALLWNGWTRLPLLGACAFAYVLVSAALIDPDDDPSAIAGPAYVVYNILIIFAAATVFALALVKRRKP